jgi:hypothetical protein
MTNEKLLRAAAYVAMVGCITWLAGFIMLRAQTATPVYQFPPTTQPVCSAMFDTTNKLVTTSCSIGGVAMAPISYNPRVLEGNAGGVFTFTFGGLTFTYAHNLAADPWKYTVGATGSGSAAIVQCGVTGGATCPTIPW